MISLEFIILSLYSEFFGSRLKNYSCILNYLSSLLLLVSNLDLQSIVRLELVLPLLILLHSSSRPLMLWVIRLFLSLAYSLCMTRMT